MAPRPPSALRLAALAAAGLFLFAAPPAGAAKEDPGYAQKIESLADEADVFVRAGEKAHDRVKAAVEGLEELSRGGLGNGRGLPFKFDELDGKARTAEWRDAAGISRDLAALDSAAKDAKTSFKRFQGENDSARKAFADAYNAFNGKLQEAVAAKEKGADAAAKKYEERFAETGRGMYTRRERINGDLLNRFDAARKDCEDSLESIAETRARIEVRLAELKPSAGPGGVVVLTNAPMSAVTFESDGTILERRKVNPGSFVGPPEKSVPPKGLHRFVGWKIDGKGELVDPATTKAPADASAINFSAVWTPVKFPVRFADSPDPESELALDDPLPAVTPPEKEHYRFLGWSADEDAGKPDARLAEGTLLKTVFNPERFSRLDLHPVWAPVSYPVRFLSRTGTSRDPVEVAAAEGSVESPVARPSDPDPVPGCVFEGWAVSGSDGFYDFGAPVEAPLDLVARWTPVAHKVFFLDFDGNPFAEAEGSVDAPVSAPAETPFRVGSAFVHWTADEAGHPWDGFGKPLLEDATLRPVGRDKVFEVSFRAGNGVEPDPEPQSVVYGGTALRPPDPEPPRAGIVFAGWTRAGKPGRAPYDFSAPVTEPLVLAGLWAFPASVRVVPGGFDASATAGGFAGRVSRGADWCAGRGFTSDWAWALSGVLGVVLLVELVALFRRR